MKFIQVAAFLFSISAFASEGNFVCLADSGLMISAGLDGEANLTNFRILRGKGVENFSLSTMEVTVQPEKFELRAIAVNEAEDRSYYAIRTKKRAGSFYEGTIQVRNAQAFGLPERVLCAVNFSASETE